MSQLKTLEAIKTFAYGGKAHLTLVSKVTGQRFTYRISKIEGAPGFFVSLLTHPDNVSGYSYLGVIKGRRFWTTYKSCVKEGPALKAFEFFHNQVLVHGRLPAQLEVWHEGRCCRCARKLTVPSSIEAGIGPECADRLGLWASAA